MPFAERFFHHLLSSTRSIWRIGGTISLERWATGRLMPSLALSCAKSPDIPCLGPLVKAVPSEYPLVPGFQLLWHRPTRLATAHGIHWTAKCPAAQQLSLIKGDAASLQKAAPAHKYIHRLAVRASRPNTGGHLEQFLPQAKPGRARPPRARNPFLAAKRPNHDKD